MDNVPVIKVFVAGEGGVGKTTLIDRLVKGVFNSSTLMTIGANFAVQPLTTSSGKKVHLQIWDLGGEERFRFILPMYIKGSTAGMIVFDTTRYSSFKNLADGWIKIIRDNLPDVPLILVGTKTDLEESSADEKKYIDFVKENNFQGLIFTSSKSGENVEKSFRTLADFANL